MSKNRKNEHLKYAREYLPLANDFDKFRFIHHSVPSLSIDDIKLETTILDHTFPYPFYINAMTGGTAKGDRINFKLAALANHFNLPFFIGSQSLAFKDPSIIKTYEKLRETYPTLFIVSNLNPNFTAHMADKAVQMVKANALAIHINSVQEMVMAEGDRDFRLWESNIKAIIQSASVPVIVKEVGYGMHQDTLNTLYKLGVRRIDVSGTGGTNFSHIELKRRGEEGSPLLDFGLSTVESITTAVKDGRFIVHASGGVRNAGDIVKALALGAKAVGLARYFLELSDLSLDEMILMVEELINDLQKILLLLNVKNPGELTKEHLYLK